MQKSGFIFSKIEFADCDIYVPFDCQKCGNCCSGNMPWFPHRDLIALSIYYGTSEDDVVSSYELARARQIKGDSAQCIFERGTVCSIYDHQLRPECCALYPFSYLYASITNCPGLKIHANILEEIMEGERPFAVYDSSFCPDEEFRPPSEGRAIFFWKRFIAAKPSPVLVRKYLVINELDGVPGNSLAAGHFIAQNNSGYSRQ